MKLLFLDIDGVLNSAKWLLHLYNMGLANKDNKLDPQAISLLNNITDATGAKIVISSTWRLIHLWNDTTDLLFKQLKDAGVTGDIIGVTPDHQRYRGRGGEIKAWMDQSGLDIDSFAIIDDDNDMDPILDHLIKTTYNYGLTNDHVDAVIKILNGK